MTVFAGPSTPIFPGIPGVSKGYQQITVLTAAVSLTVPAGATGAMIVADTQAVRWRDDGTAPTAAIGMPLPAGTVLWCTGNLAVIQFIQEAATAVLNITYF
jgi:hypothetical protein